MNAKPRVSQGRKALMEADPVLGRLMDKVGPYRLVVEPPRSVYEALARSITYQQLTGKAAATIFGRVCALPGGSGAAPPPPEALLKLDDSALRGAGLSGSKTAALKDLAHKAHTGAIPDIDAIAAMSDDDAIAALVGVRGIGAWSVQMLLMFRLGRKDIFPVTDFGIQKGFGLTFRGAQTPAAMVKRAERWRPHRTMASWYLWRATELG